MAVLAKNLVFSAFLAPWLPTLLKKGYWFSRPQQGCHQLNSPWAGIIKLFPARESLVSDIPAGDRKNVTFFLQCMVVTTPSPPSTGFLSHPAVKVPCNPLPPSSPPDICNTWFTGSGGNSHIPPPPTTTAPAATGPSASSTWNFKLAQAMELI